MSYSEKIQLTNPRGIPFALSNMFEDQFELKEYIYKMCEGAEDLVRAVNKYCDIGLVWRVSSDNNSYTKLVTKDRLGNIYYLLVYKDSSSQNSDLSKYGTEELVMELNRRGFNVSKRR